MKFIKFMLVLNGLVSAIKFVKRVNRVAHDPKVIDAWRDVVHDTRWAFDKAYKKYYTEQVENVINEIQKES